MHLYQVIQHGKFFTTQYDITIDDIYETLLDISANSATNNISGDGKSDKKKNGDDLHIDEDEELTDKKQDSKPGFAQRVRRNV